MRCLIIPGNGCPSYPAPITNSNFYGDVAERLAASKLFTRVIPCSMPDPNNARRSIWIPHLVDVVGIDEKTVVIGHSSGAECALRLAEEHKLAGIVLAAACLSDLGDSGEQPSGWYPPSGGDWQWDKIKANCGFIIQFHSTDDPFINVDEARQVSQALGSEYHEFTDKSHFFEPFDEIVDRVVEKLQAEKIPRK